MNPKAKKKLALVPAILSILLTVAAGLFVPAGWNFIVVMTLLLIFLAILGIIFGGRPAGILINERFLMSLSRLQLVIWTTILVSALLTIALARVRAAYLDPDAGIDPVDITVDGQLWALLGISGTSFLGATIVHGAKKNEIADDPTAVEEAATAYQEDPKETAKRASGILYANKEPKDAEFADLFQGDELKNALTIDMGKVQMFFFTIVAAVTYSAAIFQLLVTSLPQDVTAFPPVSDGLVVLLGISHGTYLGGKTVDKTKTV
jgi:hypothetical protein